MKKISITFLKALVFSLLVVSLLIGKAVNLTHLDHVGLASHESHHEHFPFLIMDHDEGQVGHGCNWLVDGLETAEHDCKCAHDHADENAESMLVKVKNVKNAVVYSGYFSIYLSNPMVIEAPLLSICDDNYNIASSCLLQTEYAVLII